MPTPNSSRIEVVQSGPASQIVLDRATGLYSGVVAGVAFDGVKNERDALMYVIERLNRFELETLAVLNALQLAQEAHQELATAQDALAHLYVVGQRIEAPSVMFPAKEALDKTAGGPRLLEEAVRNAPLPTRPI